MTIEKERYYWLKLHKDFFKRKEIVVVENLDDGKDYILFYLKLLCESVDREGRLMLTDTVPYSEQTLASVTGTKVSIVHSAIEVFMSLKMIEILDDKTIFMSEIAQLTGSESKWAKYKKKSYLESRDGVKKLE
ncbi:MAG: phage replisome organizer N-terminal domain-containing protein [Bacillota bacterium]